jgi:Spy/CpxP family protein refolding chaperone
MLFSTLSKFVVLIALVSVFVLASPVHSQNYCTWDSWDESAGTGWWNSNVPAQYALSAEQVDKINKLHQKYNQKINPLQKELRLLRNESRGYSSQYNADIDKVKDYRQQMRELEGEIADYRLDVRKDINKLLTKEQQPFFAANGYGWWDMDDDCWYGDGAWMESSYEHMDSCCR